MARKDSVPYETREKLENLEDTSVPQFLCNTLAPPFSFLSLPTLWDYQRNLDLKLVFDTLVDGTLEI